MDYSVRMIHMPNSGVKPALGFRGRKYVHCVINDETSVRVIELDPREFEKADDLRLGKEPYPVPRFVKHMQRIGKDKGITHKAERLLEQASSSQGVSLEPEALDALTEEPGNPQEGAPSCPPPGKPPKGRSESLRKPPGGPERGAIGALAAELGLAPAKVRKILRSEGLGAPYDNPEKLRAVFRKLGALK